MTALKVVFAIILMVSAFVGSAQLSGSIFGETVGYIVGTIVLVGTIMLVTNER